MGLFSSLFGRKREFTAGGDFANQLYHRLSGTQAGKNLFLSPFSIQVALAMCAAGARGETRRVMADLIGAPEDVDEQNRQYAKLIKSVEGDGKRQFELITANALWGQQGYGFNPDFQHAIADFYDGALREMNFVGLPDKAVTTINDWVSKKTSGKIRDLIKRDFIEDSTRLILTNAIYFKGLWENPFRKEGTIDECWHGLNGTTFNVPTMRHTGSHLYCENREYQALELPYKGGQLGLLVVLPRRIAGLASLESRWTTGRMYHRVVARLRHEETVIVSLPRFKMEAEFRLESVLCDMGIKQAFSDDADFGGISDVREKPLKISKVIHKAYVEVNEQGTEAAAATAIAMILCFSASPRAPVSEKVFKADHPFLFFIRDRRTDIVLFSGRLVDPR